MEEPQPVHDHDQDPPIPQNPPVQNTDPNPNPDPPITAPSDHQSNQHQHRHRHRLQQHQHQHQHRLQQHQHLHRLQQHQHLHRLQQHQHLHRLHQQHQHRNASTSSTSTAPPPAPAPHRLQQQPPPPPAAPAPQPPPPSVPPESKKRPLDNCGPIQECSYFKMRAVVKDIRPHVLEMLGTVDFRSCKGAEELQEKLKLLMELYKQMTAEKATITKWKITPNSSESGVGLKPQEQLQETADQSQPGQVFAKPSEKQQAEHSENQGTHIVGGSAFGWNFITFPGSKPNYYGRTKELFRAARVTL
ncbi:hypothetical protein BDE02_14G067000 [Populus trichocarpa]|nr:hypothetical protein BDE02_14G067000 [Populus trichocarpa]